VLKTNSWAYDCAVAASLEHDTAHPEFANVFAQNCSPHLTTCSGPDASSCESFCRDAWELGHRPSACETILPDENAFVKFCYPQGPLGDIDLATLGDCCGKYPEFDDCSDLCSDYEDGLVRIGLFDAVLQDGLACAAFCRAQGNCKNQNEADYQNCILEKVNDPSASGLEHATALFNAKTDCCIKFPNAGFGKCSFFRKTCAKVKKDQAVTDDYGSPIDGQLLSLLKTSCEKVDEGSGALGGGAIAGIVISSVVVVAAIVGAVVYIFVVRKNQDQSTAEDKANA
jgi:hypothetical protein